MLTLLIDKHFISIQGAMSYSFQKVLINAFSIPVANSWFAKNQMIKKATAMGKKGEGMIKRAKAWDGTKKFIYKNGTVVPTGLLHQLIEVFSLNNVEYQVIDTRKFLPYIEGDVALDGIDLYPFQQQAVDIMAKKGYGLLHAGTGAGKTEVAAGLIKKLGIPKTLFLTHRNLLSSQTQKRLQKRLGLPIGIIEGKVFDEQQVTIAMIPTMFNRIKKDDKQYIEIVQGAELVIGDEIHLGTSDSWLSVFTLASACNTYGLSGTPFKGNSVDDTALMATIGPEVFKVPSRWLIENGYLTPPLIRVVPIKHPKIDGTYAEQYSDLIVNNNIRHELIKTVVEQDLKKHTLVLVNEIEHGEQLFKILEPLGAKYINSKVKRTTIDATVNEFTNGELKLLISTPLLDIGVDIPVLDRLLLCAGAGKAITAVLQRIGRSLRRSEGKVLAEVFDIVDMDNEYLYNHFKERLEIYTHPDQQFKVEIFDIGNQIPPKLF